MIKTKLIKRAWTQAEETFLIDNLDKMVFTEICTSLHRSENAVNLHLHYLHIGRKKYIKDSNNVLIQMLNKRFINYKWFKPDTEFYRLTGTNQKRFQYCLKGQRKLTNDELLRINEVLKLTYDELLDAKQLNMFK